MKVQLKFDHIVRIADIGKFPLVCSYKNMVCFYQCPHFNIDEHRKSRGVKYAELTTCIRKGVILEILEDDAESSQTPSSESELKSNHR